MIYTDNQSGVFKIENNMKKSQDITVGYRVEKADKEVTFRFSELPRDLIDEVSSVTNKIARFAEENPKLNKQE